jgi:hypothetical protein
MYEIHAQYNWMFPLHVLFFHIISMIAMSSWTWLRGQETSWYREGMHGLVSRWCRAVDVDGDYVEKYYV